MPIWLRRATFKFINDYNIEQNEAMEAAQKGNSKTTNLINADGKVNVPDYGAKKQSSYK